jgi:hypothetical protein
MKVGQISTAFLACALLYVAPASSQFIPGRFNLPEALHYIDSLSKAYLNRVGWAQGSSDTRPTESDYKALRADLDILADWLGSSKEGDSNVLKPATLTPESMALVNNALQCANCAKPGEHAIAKTLPKTAGEIRVLLLARVTMIQAMIPTNGKLSKDVTVQLDTQMYYLRTIVDAYDV